MEEIAKKMSKARAGLVLDMPFFGSLALRLAMIPDESCDTAWTDGKMLGYKPSFIGSLSLEKVKGLICHEVMHLAAAHQARRQGREKKKWNRAGDYAINPILEDAKIVLPEGRLIDDAFEGMSAEAIYTRLPDSPPDDDGQQEGDKSDPGGCGEVRDAPGPDGKQASPADLSQSEQEWKVAVSQAAQQAKAMGTLPAGLARLVEEILEPKVDWKEVLRRFVDETSKNDYSWSPPNRRYLPQGLYLPSLKSEELRPIVVVCDTSGSVTDDDVEQFSAEVTAILEDYNTSCTVIYCDTKVADYQEFSSEDLPLKLNPIGGGGTDFRPPFKWVEERQIQPSCLIYLTDMDCTRFPEMPEYPVLWAHMGKGGEKAPFGEEVEL